VAPQQERDIMNSATLRYLGFIVAFLVIAWFLVESGDESDLPDSGRLLFDDMAAVLNDIDTVSVTRASTETVVVRRLDDGWGLADRDDYPASLERIRDVLIAMAEARVVEPKTADPARHYILGVDDPTGELSKGTLVTATAGDRGFSLVFGNVSQGTYRYARIAGESQSWLIDQNPEIPATIGEWLSGDIIDIPSTRIQSVSILHPDGETISVTRSVDNGTEFLVADIPDGRELSYSTVANGLAGALNDLDLDDVRAAGSDETAAVVAEFLTDNALKVTARTSTIDDAHWLTLTAESAEEDSSEADELNARLAGWEFRIADYKANLLTRRWEDILKPVEPETE
jgi:hypothetical protein